MWTFYLTFYVFFPYNFQETTAQKFIYEPLSIYDNQVEK